LIPVSKPNSKLLKKTSHVIKYLNKNKLNKFYFRYKKKEKNTFCFFTKVLKVIFLEPLSRLKFIISIACLLKCVRYSRNFSIEDVLLVGILRSPDCTLVKVTPLFFLRYSSNFEIIPSLKESLRSFSLYSI